MTNQIPGMNGEAMVNFIQTMVDDTIDPVQILLYLNMAKDEVEAGRDWYFNRSFDNSQVWNPGDTYLTMKNLPADFLASRELYLDQDILPYIQITFELRQRFKDIYRRYYIDYKNKQFAICGSGPGQRAINHYYACSTDQITLGTTPVWPAQFHPIIPLRAAEIWGSSQDADDINLRLSQNQLRHYNDLLKMMIAWDGRLKTRDYNNKNSQNYDLKTQPNVVATEFLM